MEEAASTTRIALTAQIDAPYRRLQAGDWTRLNRKTFIGEGCDIGHFSLIGEEAYLGEGTIIDAYCMVEGGVTLGKNVLLTHRASVEAKAKIGDSCIIGGTLICEKSRIGDNCRVFGNLIHRQLDPTIDWDAEEAEEPAPQLADNVFVGWGATIIGGVNIGEGSYICAGATVTKDVPPHHIVTGTNKLHTPPRVERRPSQVPLLRITMKKQVPTPGNSDMPHRGGLGARPPRLRTEAPPARALREHSERRL